MPPTSFSARGEAARRTQLSPIKTLNLLVLHNEYMAYTIKDNSKIMPLGRTIEVNKTVMQVAAVNHQPLRSTANDKEMMSMLVKRDSVRM
jgi:hypothetical protein